MANDVTAQVRDKLIDIIIAVLTRECEDFDGETVRRLIVAELDSTPICFALEKRVAVSKTPKTKVVELDADGNTVKKVRTPKEPKEKAPKALKEKAPKAPKAILTEEEREARKAAKQAEKEAAKEARKAEKAAAKDADKEAAKEAAKLAKQAAKEAAKLAKQAERDAVKAAKKAEKEAAAEPVAKPVKEQRIPMPWCGVRISDRCEALRAYHGLFAQCTADATETSMFCTSCEKTGAQFGTVTMRAACGLFDYTAPNGKKCVRLANVVDKFEVEGGIDAFVAEAAKHGITIPAEHLEKEVKQRGRPKSTSPRASTATKIATSDTGSGSGSETETDDEEYQAKKQAKQQQRKKVTKTAAAAADTDAAPKKRGRPAKAKEPVVEPKDSLIQDLVASAKKSASATPTPKAATPAAATPELIEDEMIITTPISSPAAAAAAVVAPAAPKKAASASVKPKAAPKPVRKVVELDGDKFWEESFEGMDLYVRCSDNIAFDRSNGNGVGTWDDKAKTLIEDDESDADDEE
jgi:hypothetical protein